MKINGVALGVACMRVSRHYYYLLIWLTFTGEVRGEDATAHKQRIRQLSSRRLCSAAFFWVYIAAYHPRSHAQPKSRSREQWLRVSVDFRSLCVPFFFWAGYWKMNGYRGYIIYIGKLNFLSRESAMLSESWMSNRLNYE